MAHLESLNELKMTDFLTRGFLMHWNSQEYLNVTNKKCGRYARRQKLIQRISADTICVSIISIPSSTRTKSQ